MPLEGAAQALSIAGGAIAGLVLTFLIVLATGWAPRCVLSLESRLLRLAKRRKRWDWTMIEPGVFLGSLPRLPCHLDELRAEGVGAVLTLNENWELAMSPQCVQDCHMVQRNLPTPDFFAPSQRDLVEAVAFIRKHVWQGVSVYVHCNGGKGRSAVCVICYLIHEHGWSPDQAFQFVKDKRKITEMKAWCGFHKQWRAVQRFTRELQRVRKEVAYKVPREMQETCSSCLVPKKASTKIVPVQASIPQPQVSNGNTSATHCPAAVVDPVADEGDVKGEVAKVLD